MKHWFESASIENSIEKKRHFEIQGASSRLDRSKTDFQTTYHLPTANCLVVPSMPRLLPFFTLAVPVLIASGSQTRADDTPPSFARPLAPASTITGVVNLPPVQTARPVFRPIVVAPSEARRLPEIPLILAAPLAPAPKVPVPQTVAVPMPRPKVVIPVSSPSSQTTAGLTTTAVVTSTGNPATKANTTAAKSPTVTAPALKTAPTMLAALPSSTKTTDVLPKTDLTSAPTPSVASSSVAAPTVPARALVPDSATRVPPAVRTPSRLSSREAAANQLLLARLDAQLAGAERRLNRAEARLTEGQRQLGAFTDVLRAAMLEAGPDARGLHPFVRVAQRYLGTPYVWGGESARGFDCSGFIMRVMRDLGYRALPHSAAEQFRYGMPIVKNALKPGDIVFFANTYKPGISHVGIYLGGTRFIHAANSKVGTIVSSLAEPKWIEHYAGARRLVPARS